MHHHITRDDRVVISLGLKRGESYREIGESIGKDKGAVFREVNRNQDADGIYRVWSADRRAKNRRRYSKKATRLLEQNKPLADTVEALLDPLVSPKVIGYCLGIHHQTIYDWIYHARPDLKERLPYRGKKRRRYGTKRAKQQGWTRDVRSIHDRVEAPVSWEGDTLRGSTRARLLTHVEYTTLYTRVDLMTDGTADSVHAALKHTPLSGTLTYDRGSEFALWRMIERDTPATVFFADPHSPWQRGKNENTNGRLRRVFPKRTDFSTISKRELANVVDLMNHTPRESLSWRYPAELFYERCISD